MHYLENKNINEVYFLHAVLSLSATTFYGFRLCFSRQIVIGQLCVSIHAYADILENLKIVCYKETNNLTQKSYLVSKFPKMTGNLTFFSCFEISELNMK